MPQLQCAEARAQDCLDIAVMTVNFQRNCNLSFLDPTSRSNPRDFLPQSTNSKLPNPTLQEFAMSFYTLSLIIIGLLYHFRRLMDGALLTPGFPI